MLKKFFIKGKNFEKYFTESSNLQKNLIRFMHIKIQKFFRALEICADNF